MTSSDDAAALRVALVGYGKGGSVFHAPLIATTPGLRLAAVVTGDPGRAARARADHPGVEVVPSAEELWRRAAEVDLVVITTPNRTHAPLAAAALAAGLPAVVDKPFATSAAAARELRDTAQRLGLMLTAYQNRRWDSDYLTVWRLVDEGELGRVVRFESRFERWRPEPGPSWRERGGEDDGAGILFDLGSHLIDQALNLFGPVESVYAELDRRRPGMAVEDDAFVALRHRGGVRSHLSMSMLAAQGGPRFRVLGDRAAYTVDGLDGQEARLTAGERPGGPDWGVEPEERWGRIGADGALRPVPSERGDYPHFYAAVRDAVAEGEPAPVDLWDVVQGLEVIEAARRSAELGRAVAPGAAEAAGRAG
ncbi:Gfo/Idh/MocA family oxidoreductase [Allonocardiopsis opalescens]|uniref:Putative dehydrogenase n=1 Tax=Allonocardiopsis opalescens TaxID=1144618 RepID=A0A2T0PVY9_9ACTN|nr:Gfo/Idh/MocA family oxidoreductase [Allonocardiopsis opalescens]PRX95705.1 putative dehydrogenase [Allonocardiopsis opalescens]